jgi:16S rRNA G1207 methylase RsmC
MFSLESFCKKHKTDTTEVAISGRKYKILLPADPFKLIDRSDVFHEFPMWAKIWRASWVLASSLAEMPVDPSKKFMEIGAGVGLVSIAAACCGHRITMSERNTDALQFARANAVINGCPHLTILELDWNHPQLTDRFDYIVASEVTYKKDNLQALLALFQRYLRPGGEVIIAGEMRRQSKDLYKRLKTIFSIRVQKIILRSDYEAISIFLFRMTLRE